MTDDTTTTAKRTRKGAEPEPTAKINDRQMRQLHAVLHDHAFTDADAIHELLSVHLGREIASRKDLTITEAADFIAWLNAEARTVTPEIMRKLRAPFPDEAIGQLPRSTCKDCSDNRGSCTVHPNKARCSICGNVHNTQSSMHLSYVGHADVTDRLLQVDPLWTWRPFTPDELAGIPPVMREAGIWIMLTVAGITRPGFGDADGKRGGNAVKEAIGDALRNSAMRFGVALDLWAKGDRTWLSTEKDGDVHGAGAPQDEYNGPTTAQLLAQLGVLAKSEGTDLEGITAKWRERNGGIPAEALAGLAPMTIAPLVESIERFINEREAQQAQS